MSETEREKDFCRFTVTHSGRSAAYWAVESRKRRGIGKGSCATQKKEKKKIKRCPPAGDGRRPR